MLRWWARRSCLAEGCFSEQEVDNLQEALTLVLSYKMQLLVITPDMVMEIHRCVLKGDFRAGHLRNVYVGTSYNNEAHLYPPPALVEPRLYSLCDAYNEVILRGATPTVKMVARFVFEFLSLHPFHDGNGRTARVLVAYCLGVFNVDDWVQVIVSARKSVDTTSLEKLLHESLTS